MRALLAVLTMLPLLFVHAVKADTVRSFGVLNQRSATLTAQYWNPILAYVGKRSGITLELRMGKSAPETTAMTARGEFDYVYSNHIFTPAIAHNGYRVIARPVEELIEGQIVVPADSPIRMLNELAGKEVGFPSATAFVGYAVPMNELLQRGIQVKPVFAGNQEGIMGQLKAGRVVAAAVNSKIMRDYGLREQFRYRVLWSSEGYLNLPIATHPRIPKEEYEVVAAIFAAMADDPEGQRILAASGAAIGQQPPYGFVRASNHDYENYMKYYRTTLVKEFR